MSKAKFEFGIDSRQLGLYFGIDSMLHVKGGGMLLLQRSILMDWVPARCWLGSEGMHWR